MSRHSAGTRVSEYVLEECLGKGSFGEVWRARHHIWEAEQVAIKLPTEPEYVRYLQREGVMVHGLRHPNVVRVLGLDPYADPPYLVMELVNGPSLGDVLRERRGGMPIDAVMAVLRGMLAGLHAAHEARVLHRDLKPGNVLLNLDGRPVAQVSAADVKLGDFGLGVHSEEALRSLAHSASMAREDVLVGTLAYMAPEVRDGAPADPRSDLYSAGIVLFEMLTGDRPAGAELPSTLRGDVPRVLDEVFRRLYARHDRRFAAAADVLAELDAAAHRPRGPFAARAYEVSAADEAGKRVDQVVHAASPEDAAETVRRRGLKVIRVLERGTSVSAPAAPATGMGVTCRTCWRRGEPGDQFCTHCGAQLAERVRKCEACGSFPGPHDLYCIFCGARLSGEAAS